MEVTRRVTQVWRSLTRDSRSGMAAAHLGQPIPVAAFVHKRQRGLRTAQRQERTLARLPELDIRRRSKCWDPASSVGAAHQPNRTLLPGPRRTAAQRGAAYTVSRYGVRTISASPLAGDRFFPALLILARVGPSKGKLRARICPGHAGAPSRKPVHSTVV
jgi:hypothetical protein